MTTQNQPTEHGRHIVLEAEAALGEEQRSRCIHLFHSAPVSARTDVYRCVLCGFARTATRPDCRELQYRHPQVPPFTS